MRIEGSAVDAGEERWAVSSRLALWPMNASGTEREHRNENVPQNSSRQLLAVYESGTI
jgi:hypothetical protein